MAAEEEARTAGAANLKLAESQLAASAEAEAEVRAQLKEVEYEATTKLRMREQELAEAKAEAAKNLKEAELTKLRLAKLQTDQRAERMQKEGTYQRSYSTSSTLRPT